MTERRPGMRRPEEPFALAGYLAADGAMGLRAAFARVVEDWATQVEQGRLTPAGVETYAAVASTLLAYLEASGIEMVCDVTSDVLWRWVNSPATGMRAAPYPSDNTRRLRRSAARGIWDTFYFLGISEWQIPASLPAVKQRRRKVAPLTDRQVQQCKDIADYDSDASAYESGYSRVPSCLALTLLGAQAGEVSAIQVRDVDLLNRRVWLHSGGDRYRDRWVPIDDGWAWEALAARVAYLTKRYGDPQGLIAYRPHSPGPHALKERAAATSRTLRTLLQRAGVDQRGRNRVAAVLEYTALRVFITTGRVESVAARLGIGDLNAAARLVGYDWQAEFNPDPGTGDGMDGGAA